MKQTQYDVFISYSRKDYMDEHKNVIPGNEVSKIKDALAKAEISYWFDEEGIYSGDDFVDKIVTNIKASKVFVFLATQNANTAEWTPKEIATASELGKYIIPVRIDNSPYNEKVLFRIADLSFISYNGNPEKGIKKLINSIKAYLAKSKEEMEKAEEINREIDQKRLAEQKKIDDSKVVWWKEYNMRPVRLSPTMIHPYAFIFFLIYYTLAFGIIATIGHYFPFNKNFDNPWFMLTAFILGVSFIAFFIKAKRKLWFFDVRKKRQELLDDDYREYHPNVRYVLVARGTASSHKFGLFDSWAVKLCIPIIYDELKWMKKEKGRLLHGVIDGNSVVVDVNGNQYT